MSKISQPVVWWIVGMWTPWGQGSFHWCIWSNKISAGPEGMLHKYLLCQKKRNSLFLTEVKGPIQLMQIWIWRHVNSPRWCSLGSYRLRREGCGTLWSGPGYNSFICNCCSICLVAESWSLLWVFMTLAGDHWINLIPGTVRTVLPKAVFVSLEVVC